jgi:hypothetical protein
MARLYKQSRHLNTLRGMGSALDVFPPAGVRRRRYFRMSAWAALCRDGAKVARDLRAALEKCKCKSLTEKAHAR